ncbi:DUF3332 domain-containing protein [Vibrio cortegadensis]|uniref:DUF3332 domain-containing protein n=1 Tax=Vibrio cortegadensis TaxID=1328770 RepID=A0ABV4M476_9VIBR
MKVQKMKLVSVMLLSASTLTGCMGQMATTGLVSKFNLQLVDNRYAREGVFLLLSPVYGIASVADMFIFNSIEFWTGKNPISGKSPAVVDSKLEAIIKVNSQLDKSLTEAPIQVNNQWVEDAVMKQIDENTLQMDISYQDGTKQIFRGEKSVGGVNFYLDNELITFVSVQELDVYTKTARI